MQGYSQNQELKVGAYNIGLGAVIGGVGSLINKEKKEKPLYALWRGVKYGALGGTGMYLGKKLSYQVNNSNSLAFAWPSKILHNAGASIVENASAHSKNIFGKWNFSIGFVRLSVETKDRWKLQGRIMPASFATFVIGCFNERFLAKESIQYGTPVFSFSSTSPRATSTIATTLSNTVYVVDTLNTTKFKIYAHEHIHVLQQREYVNINTWFGPLYNQPSVKNNKFVSTLSKYIYPDVPYNYAVYGIMYRKGICYFNNFHEFEAEYFATHRDVFRCK
ncbi:MAG TPA: hypothetical protein VFZ42_06765 [Chitinophagaceae bacterium]